MQPTDSVRTIAFVHNFYDLEIYNNISAYPQHTERAHMYAEIAHKQKETRNPRLLIIDEWVAIVRNGQYTSKNFPSQGDTEIYICEAPMSFSGKCNIFL